MIEKNEIIEISKFKKLNPSIIEKDYILGWILAALQNLSELFENWVFKGGTYLKKCCFDDYRFLDCGSHCR